MDPFVYGALWCSDDQAVLAWTNKEIVLLKVNHNGEGTLEKIQSITAESLKILNISSVCGIFSRFIPGNSFQKPFLVVADNIGKITRVFLE